MKRTVVSFGAVLSLILLVSAMKSVAVNVDLESRGIPIIVDVPNGSVVSEGLLSGMDMGESKTLSWEINQGEFSLDISMEDAAVRKTHAEYLRYERSVVEMDPSFDGYIESDNNGFLVKLDFDGVVEYDFYHLVTKNNRAIEFSVGLGASDYSKENIRKIYRAAKTAK
ncbi:MAG: hypothetical protein P8P74_11445 [Crocinitomicaceae bacterium]|nr:hypothetical protein [Crocinitomicaceae bacterium]